MFLFVVVVRLDVRDFGGELLELVEFVRVLVKSPDREEDVVEELCFGGMPLDLSRSDARDGVDDIYVRWLERVCDRSEEA